MNEVQEAVTNVTSTSRKYLLALGTESVPDDASIVIWLIKAILAEGPTEGMTLDALASALHDQTGLEFDRVELRETIEKSENSDLTLMSYDPPQIVLSSGEREEVLKRLSEASDLESEVIRDWHEELRNEFELNATVSQSDLLKDLRIFSANVALIHGLESVSIVYGDDKQRRHLLESLAKAAWQGIPERHPGYLEYCHHQFPMFFITARGTRATFVATLLDRTFELCRLNCAPEASKLILEQLSGLTIYLDTNIVFRLLGIHGPAAHLDIRRTLELCRKAKAEVRVTPRTVEEFVSAAKKFAQQNRLPRIPPEALLSLDATKPDVDFFRDYRRLLVTASSNVADLKASLSNVSRTLEAFGIRVRNDKFEILKSKTEEINALSRELQEFYQQKQDRKSPEQRKDVSWEVAEHDAVHVILIELLRPKTDTFHGAKFWFLTSHRALTKKAFLRAKDSPPVAILLEQWHQLLRTVLPRSQSFDSTFVRNLHSPLFQAHRANYVDAYKNIFERLSNYRSLSDEHFAGLVTDAAFISKVAVALGDDPDRNSEQVADKLVDERIGMELRRERDRNADLSKRLATQGTTLKEAQRNGQDLQVKVSQQESTLGTLQSKISVLEQSLLLEHSKREHLIKNGLKILGCSVLAVTYGVVCVYFSHSYFTTGPVPISLVGIGILVLGVVALAFLPNKKTFIIFLVASIIAILAIPKPEEPKPGNISRAPVDTTSSTSEKIVADDQAFAQHHK